MRSLIRLACYLSAYCAAYCLFGWRGPAVLFAGLFLCHCALSGRRAQ